VQRFIDECCNVHAALKCTVSALLDAYLRWSGDGTMTAKTFGDRLEGMGYSRSRGHGGIRMFQGLQLATTEVANGDTW
jgi:hypothetical protein